MKGAAHRKADAMKLVRFGKLTINMDLVTHIEIGGYDTDSLIHLANTVEGGYGGMVQNYLRLDGSDQIALEQWLEANSEDARAPMMIDDASDIGDSIDWNGIAENAAIRALEELEIKQDWHGTH